MSDRGPPTESEISQLKEVTTQPAARLPLTVEPATGMFPYEFLHLHEDWIVWPTDEESGPNYPIITVPVGEECRRAIKQQGRRKSTVGINEQDAPCPACKYLGKEKYQSPSELDTQRTIPVVDEAASKDLQIWFRKFDTIPWSRGLTQLNTVAESEIDRRISLGDLRDVFVRRAVEMGINDEVMLDNMGLTQKSAKIIKWQRKLESDQITQLTYQEYLTVINDESPVTYREIATVLDRSLSAVRLKVSKLEDNGMVERVGRGDREAILFDALEPPTKLLNCPKRNCNREFDSFTGRANHKRDAH